MILPYVEIFPSLFERVSTLLRPMSPSSLKWKTTGRFPNSKREHSFAGDIDCLEKVAYFCDKEHRVHLCDNLKVWDHCGRLYLELTTSFQHGAGNDMAHGQKTQAERTCSGCHSVVYCSSECQKEDWRAFHRKECSQMSKEFEGRLSFMRQSPT